MDHCLGKEELLDLLVLRFANRILEPAWNGQHVASVQITMAEDFGVAGRGKFYDDVGALPDVIQNHLLQLLTLVAMEPPVAFDATALRDEKVKVLHAMPELDPSDVVRGQFADYRQEDGGAADSDTETFVALKAEIDSWRWAGIPVYIRAGKKLATTVTESGARMSLAAQLKEPGEAIVSRPVELSHTYEERREGVGEEAYVRLLDDALEGDQRLFARSDGVEEAWRIVGPLLRDVREATPYELGTWGSWEDIATAIDVLDGALDLSRRDAARLLVIISDGRYRPDARRDGQSRVDRLRATGCGILWLAAAGMRRLCAMGEPEYLDTEAVACLLGLEPASIRRYRRRPVPSSPSPTSPSAATRLEERNHRGMGP